MNKKVFLIIGLLFVVAGTVGAWFANIPLTQITTFAVVMFGAGLASAALWDTRDTGKPMWLSLVTIICIGLGSFLLAFGGIAEGTATTIISSIFGIISIIAGIIAASVPKKEWQTE